LLRGQSGTEWAMGDPLAAGAAFVLIDSHVTPVAQGLGALERSFDLRVIAAGRNHGDAAAVTIAATPQATALRPLSPVHVRATRGEDGIALRWVRRTRVDGDSWALPDVPLGEQAEQYEIRIMSGDDVVRTLNAAASSVLYPAAEELSDFGAPQPNLTLQVAQLSTTAGRGVPAQVFLSL
jgi:hypothetical protein